MALITVHRSSRHYNCQPSSSGLELLSGSLIKNLCGVPINSDVTPRCLVQIVFGTQANFNVVKHFYIYVKERGVCSDYPNRCQVISLGS